MNQRKRNFIYTQELRGLIQREIGGDELRTVYPTLKMLRDLHIIEENELNKWEIKIPMANENDPVVEPTDEDISDAVEAESKAESDKEEADEDDS